MAAGRRDDDFRPEIQGMRAVAVGLVVLFHLWPNRLSGGYVGVDVFFVLSGYLITSHLLREALSSGSVQLARFWGRRIRRLLPASLLVLALSTVAVVLVAPATTWAGTARQVAASALYVQNWALASDAVDYLARDQAPTVAQHYWSLSVEEQFYAAWPLLVLLALLVRRRLAPTGSPRRAVLVGLGVVSALSLLWSAWSTGQDQATAYFSTPVRAWEFGAGALAATAVVSRHARRGPWLGWAGLAAVVASGVAFTAGSAFPGWIALLPVLGTLLLLHAPVGGPLTAGWWLSLRPARWLGDVSYSVYLVHWPLVVLVPAYLGHGLRTRDKLLVIALTLVLAQLSKTFVEDPLRTGPLLTANRVRPFGFATAGMAAVVLATVGVQGLLARQETAAAARTTAAAEVAPGCLGPEALAHRASCGPVGGTGAPLAAAVVVAQESRDPLLRGCQTALSSTDLRGCHVGQSAQPRLHVALVGDSHATHWVPLLDVLGRQQGWDVRVLTKSSCPSSDARRTLAVERGSVLQRGCEAFNDAVDALLLSDRTITDVFVSSYSSVYGWSARDGRPLADPGVDGFAQRWARWIAAGKRVHVIADIPRTTGTAVPTCLLQHEGRPEACAVPRARALPADVMVAAARRLAGHGVSVIDLRAQFCDASRCYARIGDVIAYRDKTHLSIEYARLLAPYLAEQLQAPLLRRS